MDPQQEIFTGLRMNLKALGLDVYDGALPPEGTAYPFIYLGESELSDRATKTAIHGTVTQSVHVWSNDVKRRGDVSALALKVKDVARRLDHTTNFAWSVRNVYQRILTDTTTAEPLLHCIVDIEFFFS